MAAGHSSNSDWTLQVLKSDSNSHFTVEDAAKLANIKGPISSNEYERVQALRNSKALDLDDLDERFMCLVNLAGKVYKTSITIFSLFEVDLVWSKGRKDWAFPSFPREYSICNYVVYDQGPPILVVNDLQLDKEFCTMPFVEGPPYLRFYAGAPLYSDGHKIGTFCLVDYVPHDDFDMGEQQSLLDLAGSASDLIEQLREKTGKAAELDAEKLKANLLRHINAPLALVNEQYRQLRCLIELIDTIGRTRVELIEELQRLVECFRTKVERLCYTLEISLQLGIKFVPQEGSGIYKPCADNQEIMDDTARVNREARGMALQSYYSRLQQLTTLVASTGRSLNFAVDDTLHFSNAEIRCLFSKWEVMSSHRVLECLSTVISFLSLEFTTPSNNSNISALQSASVRITCCCHELNEKALQGHGQLVIELCFPLDPNRQDMASSQVEETKSLRFIQELLCTIACSLDIKTGEVGLDDREIAILVPCRLLVIL